jgi:hypothetical protein
MYGTYATCHTVFFAYAARHDAATCMGCILFINYLLDWTLIGWIYALHLACLPTMKNQGQPN